MSRHRSRAYWLLPRRALHEHDEEFARSSFPERIERHVSDPPAANETARLEAFSDGVFAIAITLLILEIRVPPSAEYAGLARALAHLWPDHDFLQT